MDGHMKHSDITDGYLQTVDAMKAGKYAGLEK